MTTRVKYEKYAQFPDKTNSEIHNRSIRFAIFNFQKLERTVRRGKEKVKDVKSFKKKLYTNLITKKTDRKF